MTPIPILSFFTGGGFLDMGFEQAGFNVVWTNENNPAFSQMYAYGMSKWHKSQKKNCAPVQISNQRDIEKISSPQILLQAFPAGRPKVFGITGGPPCPDFSVAGKNKGSKGLNGRLTKIFVNRICSIMPQFFVIENVAGLYKTRIHREFMQNLENKLESKGYCLDFKILNALEVGVPQDRERLFIVGINENFVKRLTGRKIERGEREWFPWPEISKYRNAKIKFNWPQTIKFGKNPSRPRNILSELMVDSVLNSKSHPDKKPNGMDMFNAYSNKFNTVKEGDTKRKSFKRLHRYRYSPTACYGHNEVHLHPWEKRRLTVREAMRIQGIPDEFALPPEMPLSGKFALVSNGVPVPLAHQVALSLRKFLFKNYK